MGDGHVSKFGVCRAVKADATRVIVSFGQSNDARTGCASCSANSGASAKARHPEARHLLLRMVA